MVLVSQNSVTIKTSNPGSDFWLNSAINAVGYAEVVMFSYSVCVCGCLFRTFEVLERNFTFGMVAHLDQIWVKLKYHWIKV